MELSTGVMYILTLLYEDPGFYGKWNSALGPGASKSRLHFIGCFFARLVEERKHAEDESTDFEA